ncbi:MAG: hypothetical protein K9L78_03850, partial [Victivallales bacterium]|nr:hypothetical protein [Victivallales bacterium]
MKTLNFILFLFAASVLAAGTDFPSDKYSIAPGPPNVTTELKLINGATMSVPGGKTCTRMSFKTQRLTTITINSRHDRKKLVRGIMTVKDTSKNISVPCHILFILQAKSGDKRWEPIPFTNTNENKKAFGVDYTSNVIGIGEPAPGSNSQQASLYQTLNKDVVYLVDHNPDNSNMLFRGNLPFTKGKTETSKDQRLDLKSLSQIFDKIISRFGLNSQEKYNFIVVPLIS